MNLGNDNFNLVTGADLENGEIDFGNGAKFRDRRGRFKRNGTFEFRERR